MNPQHRPSSLLPNPPYLPHFLMLGKSYAVALVASQARAVHLQLLLEALHSSRHFLGGRWSSIGYEQKSVPKHCKSRPHFFSFPRFSGWRIIGFNILGIRSLGCRIVGIFLDVSKFLGCWAWGKLVRFLQIGPLLELDLLMTKQQTVFVFA